MENSIKQKVLIVHNYYQIPGGEDTVVANEKKLLEDHGHEVVLYVRYNSELKKLSKIRKLFVPFNMIFNIRTYKEIKKIIREQKIEIVHVHNTLNIISASVYYAARKCNVPVVQTIHNFRMLCPGATFYRDGHICEDCVKHGLFCAVKHSCYRDSRAQTIACVINTLIHRATGIYKKINYICLTEFNKQKLLLLNQNKLVINPNRVFVKPNFTFCNFTNNLEKNIGDYFLFVGRVEEIKGIDVLIDAFSKLQDQKLFIAGTGRALEKYKQRVKNEGLDNISFCGFLEKEQLKSIVAGAKAVIVTSQWYETFGMVIVEAYAAKTPVVSGAIGNIGDLVEDGLTGLTFEYNSSEDLVNKMLEFEDLNTGLWGENAYQKYIREFSPDSNYIILKEVYDTISK